MHKRNLFYSFAFFLVIALAVMIYSAAKEVTPKTVTAKSGLVTLDLNSSYRDNYSATKSPKEMLLLQQSKKEDITVMIVGSVAAPDERGLSIEERAAKIEKDLADEDRLLAINVKDDEIFYAMKRTDKTISTSRLKEYAGTIVVTSVISNNDEPQSNIDAIIDSVRYHFE